MIGQVCLSKLRRRPYNLQEKTAESQASLDKTKLCQMLGRSGKKITESKKKLSQIRSTCGTVANVRKECKVKTPQSRKSSLKSIALAVQPYKNEVPCKKPAKL